MRKRSGRVALVLVGAAAFGLAGCQEEKTEARAFPDQQSCKAAVRGGSSWFGEAECDAAFAEAQQTYLETAPRYDSKALCEAEHGVDACAADPVVQPGAGGGGSIFLPLLTGYLIGQALGGNRALMSQPLVRSAGGGFATPSGDMRFSTNTGSGTVAAKAFAKAPATVGKPPMTKTQVQSRGGFGTTGSSRTGGSSGS